MLTSAHHVTSITGDPRYRNMMGNLYSERSRSASPATIATRTQSHTASAGRRRTLACHIRRLPHGKVALAIQYGHLTISQGEGYSGLNTAGFAALMAQEEASALIDTIEQTRRDLEAGGGVSGPAAKRLINVVNRATGFEGTYLSAKDARKLKADTSLTIYDNPDSYPDLHVRSEPRTLPPRRQPPGRRTQAR
jgi:hypothetical protein